MNEASQKRVPEFGGLPPITFRQLEVFRGVCKEESYTNAALELRNTRANIKRVCEDFQRAVGRPLFEENADRSLEPPPF
jgi:DNA-binding transcriptional LysR family regulator